MGAAREQVRVARALENLPKLSAAMEQIRVKSVPSARRADALRVVAELFLKTEAEQSNGPDQHQVVVHVAAATNGGPPWTTLRNRSAGCCEFEDGPSMSAETARRLACDASVVALIEGEEGEPLDVGRKTRTISPALRRLLKARDNGCRFPGRTNTRHVDAHHIEHWANVLVWRTSLRNGPSSGETKPSNLVSLCSYHHRKVHEGGMRVEMLDDGAIPSPRGEAPPSRPCDQGIRASFTSGRAKRAGEGSTVVRFTTTDGKAFDSSVRKAFGDWTQLPLQHEDQGIHINARTAATRWAGERCDYGLSVEVLMIQGNVRAIRTSPFGRALLLWLLRQCVRKRAALGGRLEAVALLHASQHIVRRRLYRSSTWQSTRMQSLITTAAFLLAVSVSGCMTPGKLPNKSSPDLLRIQKVEIAPIGVPASPRVRILNSNSDWFHVPGFAAKGAYVSYAGAEVGELLETVGFDYGSEAAGYFEQAVSNSGLPLARTDVSVSSENRGWPLAKCSQAIEADACVDLRLTYFGFVAAFDSSDYVPTAHASARVIRARDGKLLLERNIHYNPIDPGTAIDLFASDEFRFRDLDVMRAEPQDVVAGLRAALKAVAVELETQLRSALESPTE